MFNEKFWITENQKNKMSTNQPLRQQLEADLEKLNALPRTPGADFFYCVYFNGFNGALPGGHLRAESGVGKWAEAIKIKKPTTGSELARSQTYSELYQTIDSVLEEEGISIDKVRRTNTKPSRELFELTAKAYIRLREMGYRQGDLSS